MFFMAFMVCGFTMKIMKDMKISMVDRAPMDVFRTLTAGVLAGKGGPIAEPGPGIKAPA